MRLRRTQEKVRRIRVLKRIIENQGCVSSTGVRLVHSKKLIMERDAERVLTDVNHGKSGTDNFKEDEGEE